MIIKTIFFRSLAAGFGLALAGCVETPVKPDEPPAEIVFPAPPDEARFVFERTLFSTADLKVEDSTSRLRRLVTGERTSGRGFGKPFDVVACRGRIYVSDTVERVVKAFDVPTRRVFDIGAKAPGALGGPLGINVDARCNLYVADATAQRVMVYTADGTFVRAIGDKTLFHRLSHVVPTPDGLRVFAVDTGGVDQREDHRVRVFDVGSGEHLYDIGHRGQEPGEFNLPRDLEIGGDGLLYVVDGANFRVQVFNQDGKFLRVFGDVGRQTGQFSRPKGIAIDPEGRVYVSDTAFGNFQIFDPQGQLLLYVGSRSSRLEPAKYMLPSGIDVDEDGRVYMVDQFFRKVDIYRPASLPKESGHLGAWYKKAASQ